MGGGPKYNRFAGLDRPKPQDYIDRVVTNSEKKINKEGQKCVNCGFEAMYKFIRCPKCGALNETKHDAEDHDESKNEFPSCRGTFDTCPSEEELNKFLEEKKAPIICGKCSAFMERRPKGITPVVEKHVPQNMELYNKLFKRKGDMQK